MLGSGWAVTATLLAPALRLNLRRRAANGREIADRLQERFGLDPTPRPNGPLIWMHAASVGETMSILPVLEGLLAHATVLVTTGTVTSQRLLDQRLPAIGRNERVLHRFAPLDVPAWVRTFLDHWRPDAACFVESELWPNQLAACRDRGIPLMLINARMSDRSFGRWQLVPGLARQMLNAFTMIRARGSADADRLRALGASRVENAGDLKYASPVLPADPAELRQLRALLGERPVWLAASTHPGEDEIIAEAHNRLTVTFPALLTIIAPRHPDRGAILSERLRAPRRSQREMPPETAGLWIADTLGEMGLWYRVAPAVLVGRSLLPPGGGQNPLEPARLKCAIAVGPHTANFADHIALLRQADALAQVGDAASLAAFIVSMLSDPSRRSAMGHAAACAVNGFEDLPRRTAEAILSLLPT